MSDKYLTSEHASVYAQSIVNDLLGLRVGDALSINTEEVDLEFAKIIANYALKKTDVTVKIVVINNGRPSQVLEFDPTPPAHTATAFAMLKLTHISKRSALDDSKYLNIQIDANNLAAIQKLGHLAEPLEVGRRISVPWCIAYVFDADDADSWAPLLKKISLSVANQDLATTYRRQSLSEYGLTTMYFEGPEMEFSVRIPQSSRFISGHHFLPSGREFLSSMDFDEISFLVDNKSTSGYFTADTIVFGRPVRAKFVFKDGYLVDWTHEDGIDLLFSFDDMLRRVGFLSAKDGQIQVFLGGARVDALAEIPLSEDLLPDWFNTSLYSLRCTLVGPFDISCTDNTGHTHTLATASTFTI